MWRYKKRLSFAEIIEEILGILFLFFDSLFFNKYFSIEIYVNFRIFQRFVSDLIILVLFVYFFMWCQWTMRIEIFSFCILIFFISIVLIFCEIIVFSYIRKSNQLALKLLFQLFNDIGLKFLYCIKNFLVQFFHKNYVDFS